MRTMNPMRIPAVTTEMFIAAIERQLGRPIDQAEQDIVDRMAAHNWPATSIADELRGAAGLARDAVAKAEETP